MGGLRIESPELGPGVIMGPLNPRGEQELMRADERLSRS